jgi:hypothetical protein
MLGYDILKLKITLAGHKVKVFFLIFQCAKVTMSILTLARFILEYSLMDYDIIRLSDSKVAAAALYMALRMNKLDGWNKTLEYYAGELFKIQDVHQKWFCFSTTE